MQKFDPNIHFRLRVRVLRKSKVHTGDHQSVRGSVRTFWGSALFFSDPSSRRFERNTTNLKTSAFHRKTRNLWWLISLSPYEFRNQFGILMCSPSQTPHSEAWNNWRWSINISQNFSEPWESRFSRAWKIYKKQVQNPRNFFLIIATMKFEKQTYS